MVTHPVAVNDRPSASATDIINPQSQPPLPSPRFQFVNISDPKEIHGPQNRRRVRSLVAQNYRRKQLLGHSPRSTHPCLDPDVASQYPVLNFCPVCGYSLARNRTPPNSRNPSSIFPVPIMELNNSTSLGAGRADPFGMFPIPVKPYMHMLKWAPVSVYCFLSGGTF
jgi:hypothetical protein